jgi:hypothetical protein
MFDQFCVFRRDIFQPMNPDALIVHLLPKKEKQKILLVFF